ncbi:MAG: NTP transferase domain-containing protein [Thermoplasmataceae archaeon]
MGRTAILMAGGKGARMRDPEKCLISIGKLSIIANLSGILSHSGFETVIATTRQHSKVTQFAEENGIDIVYTAGSGYETDLGEAVVSLAKVPVLVVPGDLVTAHKGLFLEVWETGTRSGAGVVTFTLNGNFSGISVMNRLPLIGIPMDFGTVDIRSGGSFNVNTPADLEHARSYFLTP